MTKKKTICGLLSLLLLIILLAGCGGGNNGGGPTPVYFVTAGGGGKVFWSPDGTNGSWHDISVPESYELCGLAYGNNRYLVVGGQSQWACKAWQAPGPNPGSWQQINAPTGKTDKFLCVTYGNGRFVAAGENGLRAVLIDGSNDWTLANPDSINVNLRGVTYANNIFVAVGMGKIITSPDGITWTERNCPTTEELRAITYGNNKFIAVGTNGRICLSDDGTTWTTTYKLDTNGHLGVVCYGERFITADTSGKYYHSATAAAADSWTSGILWNISGIVYRNHRYIAVSNGGAAYWTTDGAGFGTWNETTVSASALKGIICAP